jgi:hypothetical protein
MICGGVRALRRNTNGKRADGGRRRASGGTAGKQQTDDHQRPDCDAVISTESEGKEASLDFSWIVVGVGV